MGWLIIKAKTNIIYYKLKLKIYINYKSTKAETFIEKSKAD